MGRESGSGGWPNIDARANRRVELKVPVECKTGVQSIAGMTENIGLRGVLVRSERTCPWDELVSISFSLPDSSEVLTLGARLAHVVPDVFMGLEFLELSPGAREKIEQYVLAVSQK